LAGKKARVLYRNPDGSTVLHVEDEHDEILVTVDPDGSMLEERWSGLAGVGEALAAASPFDKVQVPDDVGRKVWTHLVEDEPPAAAPVLEPAAAPEPPPGRRVDPQYEPPKEERDTPFTRWLSWGPGSI
jgi:hypothetical protein